MRPQPPEVLGKYHGKEARDAFARALCVSEIAVIDILERRYGAGLNLAERMARMSGIPLRVWVDGKYSSDPVWMRPAHRTVAFPPAHLSPWVYVDYQAQHALVVKWARMVGTKSARIWSFLYRRNVPSRGLAEKLQLASDIPAATWLAAHTTASQEF